MTYVTRVIVMGCVWLLRYYTVFSGLRCISLLSIFILEGNDFEMISKYLSIAQTRRGSCTCA